MCIGRRDVLRDSFLITKTLKITPLESDLGKSMSSPQSLEKLPKDFSMEVLRKDYPLSNGVMTLMLRAKLQVEEDKRHLDNIRKYQSLKKKPVSIAQARKNMIIYLKNMIGYKMEHFRGMTYNKFRPIFEREYKKVQTLFKSDKDVEEPKKKRVAEETLLQESFKKLKAVEVLGSEFTQETPSNDPKEISEEDVQNMLEIVSVSEFKVEALQVNYPIIDWEIYSKGLRAYWKIIRVSGITEAYQSFKDMLKGFDREDLVAL
nr:hypothetical protein [Tanacetum cinerariifolium]